MDKQPVKTTASSELIIPESVVRHPAWIRLEDQLNWYSGKSRYCQTWYKRIRLAQIICAVLIPLLSHAFPWFTAIIGASIAVLTGVEHINQYSTLWTAYRSTTERLKHEKFLFLSSAGPYRKLPEAERLIVLAERIEEQISTEHAKWVSETVRINAEQNEKKIT